MARATGTTARNPQISWDTLDRRASKGPEDEWPGSLRTLV
jgi:hypothetical protein